MNPQRKMMLAVFALALVIRLAVIAVLLPQMKPDWDQDDYRALARSLAAGKGFVALDHNSGRELPNVVRTPVYPLVLAGLMKTCGDRLGWLLAANCLLGAATCVLTVLLARRWLPLPGAALAGFLVAIDPNSVMRCADVRTETLFTLLLVAGAWVLLRREAGGGGWFAGGLLWSLAALCRPIAVWLWLLVVAGSLLGRIKPRLAVIFLAGFFPLLGVWAARNAALTGHWFVSTVAIHNLRLYRAAGVEAQLSGDEFGRVQRHILASTGDVQYFMDRASFDQILRSFQSDSEKILLSAPLLAVWQVVVGWAKVLFGPGARALYSAMRQPPPTARVWPAVYAAALVCLVLCGVCGAVRLGPDGVWLAVLVVYFVVLAGGPESNSRFRLPITPMLAILAVAGVTTSRRTE
jgi:hypothetical protein